MINRRNIFIKKLRITKLQIAATYSHMRLKLSASNGLVKSLNWAIAIHFWVKHQHHVFFPFIYNKNNTDVNGVNLIQPRAESDPKIPCKIKYGFSETSYTKIWQQTNTYLIEIRERVHQIRNTLSYVKKYVGKKVQPRSIVCQKICRQKIAESSPKNAFLVHPTTSSYYVYLVSIALK
jgi:hypothetical protein